MFLRVVAIGIALLSARLTAAEEGAPFELLSGPAGIASYLRRDDNALVVLQKDLKFAVRGREYGQEASPVPEIRVRPGELVFLKNEEESVAHNVYDEDSAGVLVEKQLPGSAARMIFAKPGVHHLRCAIHPKMKIVVHVED